MPGNRNYENKGSREGSAHTQGLDAVTALPAASNQPWAHHHKPVLLPHFTDKATEAQKNELSFARLLTVSD